MKKDKCLIIGGAGYIGLVLLDQLQKNYDIIVFDSFFFNKIEQLKKKYRNITFIKGDINKDIKNKHFKKIKTVIHLAGLANDPSSDYNPNNTVLTNHISTIKIANMAKNNKVKKFIYASSCSVYGDHGKKLINENTIERPLTVYALSKFSSEKEILKLNKNSFQVISLRFATLFGLSPRMRFDLGVNTMTKNILQGKSIMVNGDGKQYRSFVHVKDVAASIKFFLNHKKKLNHKIYNIGSKINNVRIIELARLFKKIFLNLKIKKNLKNYDFRSYEVNFDRLSKIMNNNNFVTLEEGIKEIFNYYKNKKINYNNNIYYNLQIVKSK
tara:strand:- start:1461 stop:2438 length:978 start_codon:yes stop_codon:yes gene_type:complete